jgi:hypothetical protein
MTGRGTILARIDARGEKKAGNNRPLTVIGSLHLDDYEYPKN